MRAIKYLAVVAGIAVLASCSEEFGPLTLEEQAPKGIVFRAYTENDEEQTRTQFAENDGSVVIWSAQEAIGIFDGDADLYKFISSNQEPSGGADFICDDPSATMIEPDQGDYYYALYPYDAQATLENGIIQTTYPSTFEISRYGSFEDNMNLAVAYSTNYSLSFKNILAWVRLGFTGDEGITKIVFKGNNGEKLAGSLSIDPINKTATVLEEGASEELVLTGAFQTSESKENGKYYYIPLLALSFEKGFTITFYKDDGTTYKFVVNSSLSFNRGKRRLLYVNLAALQKQYTYTRVTTPVGASTPTFNDGDEYIVAYPLGDGSYNVFSPDKLLKSIENFKSYSLTDFALSNDKRYGMVGTRIFNNDFVTVINVSGNDDYITIDPGVGVQVNNKTAILENDTASFPKSHQKQTGIKMTISNISVYQWTASTNSCLAKGELDSEDMYILCDQILSRHSRYFDGSFQWNLAIGSTDAALRNTVANQYGGDYSITAGYINGTYNETDYEGFAFKDKFLFKPSTGLQKVYIYRRTPVTE